MVMGGTDHKWHAPNSLAAALISPRLASMSTSARIDQGSKEFCKNTLQSLSLIEQGMLTERLLAFPGFRKSVGAAPEPSDHWTVSATDPRMLAVSARGSAEYSQMWMNTTILDRK